MPIQIQSITKTYGNSISRLSNGLNSTSPDKYLLPARTLLWTSMPIKRNWLSSEEELLTKKKWTGLMSWIYLPTNGSECSTLKVNKFLGKDHIIVQKYLESSWSCSVESFSMTLTIYGSLTCKLVAGRKSNLTKMWQNQMLENLHHHSNMKIKCTLLAAAKTSTSAYQMPFTLTLRNFLKLKILLA